jgi:hypothetical protein
MLPQEYWLSNTECLRLGNMGNWPICANSRNIQCQRGVGELVNSIQLRRSKSPGYAASQIPVSSQHCILVIDKPLDRCQIGDVNFVELNTYPKGANIKKFDTVCDPALEIHHSGTIWQMEPEEACRVQFNSFLTDESEAPLGDIQHLDRAPGRAWRVGDKAVCLQDFSRVKAPVAKKHADQPSNSSMIITVPKTPLRVRSEY